MGTRNILLLMSLILIVCSPFSGSFPEAADSHDLFPDPIRIPLVGPWPGLQKQRDSNSYYFEETDYYTIELKKTEKQDRTLETIILDNLIHSYVNWMTPPSAIRIRADLCRSGRLESKTRPGISSPNHWGGGYTFPATGAKYPRAKIDVIEIDPRLTELAYDYLGLSRETRIRSFNDDARWTLMNFKEREFMISSWETPSMICPFPTT